MISPVAPSLQNRPDVPDAFICPITTEIMICPVMTKTGQSFDREAILEWLTHHSNTCPLTRTPLNASNLVPNHALRFRIEVWCRANEQEWKGSTVSMALDPDAVVVTCHSPVIEQLRRKNNRRNNPTVHGEQRHTPKRNIFCKILHKVRS